MKNFFLVMLAVLLPLCLLSETIETVPKATGTTPSVGVSKIVVRGDYQSSSALRIKVQQTSGVTYYTNLKLFGGLLPGYYVSGVRIAPQDSTTATNTTITLQEKDSSGTWMPVGLSKVIRYDPTNKASLWGRIANPGIHLGEEQRSIFYFGGPREVPTGLGGISPLLGELPTMTGRINVGLESWRYLMQQHEDGVLSDMEIQALLYPDSANTINKKLLDTKGPSKPDPYQWQTKANVETIFNEIYEANVNIIKLSWWGEVSQTIPETSVPRNYNEIFASTTFPKTCDFTLRFSENTICERTIMGQDEAGHNINIWEKCDCCTSDDDCTTQGESCVWGGCRKSCFPLMPPEQNGCDLAAGEWCYVPYGYFNPNDEAFCARLYNDCRWPRYYDIGGQNECWGHTIFTRNDYEGLLGVDNAATVDLNDVYHQVFKAAADKNMLVVPVIELDMYHLFKNEFPYHTEDLKEKIVYLLTTYGHYPNWLELYDKTGTPRKAIYLIEAISNTLSDETGDPYLPTSQYRAEFDVIASEISAELADEFGTDFSVGFILDPTPLGPTSIFLEPTIPHSFFIPQPTDLKPEPEPEPPLQSMASLLAVNPFGLPFNGWMHLFDASYCSGGKPCTKEVEAYGEEAFIIEATTWLSIWKAANIPMVADVIPGYDDRWRATDKFLIYGDNDTWRKKTAENAFFFNTAGMSLTIWNGFGEGYVFVPYKKRVFAHAEYITSDIDLILSMDSNNNPIYEETVISANYEYAKYLFVEDRDLDGVDDRFDNCPYDPNPMVSSSKEILIAPPQAGSDAYNAGAYFNTTESPNGLPVKSFTRFEMRKIALSPFMSFTYPVYLWQPDHDLDGIGDACDYGTATTKFDDISGNTRWTDNDRTRYENEHMNVLYSYWVNSDGTIPTYFKTQDYCWIRKQDYNSTLWGAPGFCTTAYGNNDHRSIINFGYSHGSDPKPVDDNGQVVWHQMSWDQNYKTVQTALRQDYPSWDTFNITEAHSGTRVNAKNTAGQYTAGYVRHTDPAGINHMQDYFFWNWRNDAIQDSPTYATSLASYGRSIRGFDAMEAEIAEDDHDFYMGYSAGIKGANPLYITGDTVNADFFYNTKLAARAERYDAKPQPVTYIKRSLPSIPFRKDKYIIDRETYLAIVGSRFGVDPLHDQSYLGLWRYDENATAHVDFKRMQEHTSALVVDDKGFLYSLVAGTTGGIETLSAYVNYPDSAGDWTLLGTGVRPDNIDEIVSIRIVANNGIYLIGKDTNYATSISSYALYRISADATGAMTFVSVTALPNDMKGMMLHDIGGDSYVTGARNGVVEIYAIEGENAVLLSSAQKPPARDYSSAYASQDGLYLAGGVTTNQDGSYSYHHDIWNFVPGTGWALRASDITASMTALFMEKIGNTLYLTSRIPNGEGNVTDQIVYSISNGTVTVNTVTVPELPTAVENYCLSEVDVTLKGGLTGNNGACTPFTHPWYKQYSIGSTVYSVAGKGNRLYVGTSTAIKVYDISDPNAMVLKSTFSTSNRIVYDLEVADGDIMYAATSKGLYKLNTANPDTLSIIGSFYSTGSYNYQYRIQLYNDNLYVGDDNGINIRHKDTFARLAYVNIGSTMDVAIANGELAMYWDSFWNSGIDIRNVDTLARKAWDNPYCSTGELTTDHGAFYLSCDGYEYRFVGLPNTYLDYFELNGDMREMQENYLYNGWVYIPDGNKVKLSTNNTVPSICGNGIIELGEFCDGNSEDCAMVDPTQWDSGTAICNSTCTAWDTGDCYDSGC